MPNTSNKDLIGDPGTAEFILLASHGLRSPLTAMRWGLEVLSKQKLGKNNPDQHELAVELHRDAQEMTNILRSMIELTRLQTGIHHIRSVPIEVKDECIKVLERYSNWAAVRDVTCTIVCDDEMQIHGDQQIFHDVIAHMISLCIDTAEPTTSIEVHVSHKEDTVAITCSGSFRLPEISHSANTLPIAEDRQIVGGTPGLLIFLISKLCKSMGWHFQTSCNSNGEYCTVGIQIPV